MALLDFPNVSGCWIIKCLFTWPSPFYIQTEYFISACPSGFLSGANIVLGGLVMTLTHTKASCSKTINIQRDCIASVLSLSQVINNALLVCSLRSKTMSHCIGQHLAWMIFDYLESMQKQKLQFEDDIITHCTVTRGKRKLEWWVRAQISPWTAGSNRATRGHPKRNKHNCFLCHLGKEVLVHYSNCGYVLSLTMLLIRKH